MKNELIDVSISTMIGMFPTLVNANNDALENEFDRVYSIVDVDNKKVEATTVKAHTGNFTQLQVNGIPLNTYNLEGMSKIETEISSIKEQLATPQLMSTSVFGTNVGGNVERLDMSEFFSVVPKGKVDGHSLNELYNMVLYRVIDGLNIPLNIGTTISNGKYKMIIYHDHIEPSGTSRCVQRVYVPLSNGSDGNSIIQSGSAESLILKS